MPKYNKKQVPNKEVYKFYVEYVKERGAAPLSYTDFNRVYEAWGIKVGEYLIAGKDVKLHAGLSTLRVRKKYSPTYIDYKETKKQGRVVRKPNTKSGFYRAKVFWRRHYTTCNSVGWTFAITRELARKLSAVMKSTGGHKKFLKIADKTFDEDTARRVYNKKVLGL